MECLRNALESDYRFELRDGALTILNASDGQPVMVNGKPLPVQADTIKSFLLESTDEAKLKLYRAILVFGEYFRHNHIGKLHTACGHSTPQSIWIWD